MGNSFGTIWGFYLKLDIDSFFALKEIAKENGGIPISEKEIKRPIRQACERIGCRPINYLYEVFEEFLKSVVYKLFPIEIRTYPFAKHYFEIAFKVMKNARENPYDFILFPTEFAQKSKVSIIPPVFKGKFTTDYDPAKNDWLLFTNVMEQFFNKKRIFCSHKILHGTNWHCKNDSECSVDKVDYPYSKCEDVFLKLLNDVLGDVRKLVPS